MALSPAATAEQAAWSDKILFPSAFSPKIWVMVPVASPPSISVSMALQPVSIFPSSLISSVIAITLLHLLPLQSCPTLLRERQRVHHPPRLGIWAGGDQPLALEPVEDPLEVVAREFGGKECDERGPGCALVCAYLLHHPGGELVIL